MNKILGSEDEDDIESLRIAALQSLKRKNANVDVTTANSQSNFRSAKGNRNKWGRFTHPGRPTKTGHSRIRNTNLISITPVSDETETTSTELATSLPDVKKEECTENKETCSKFNRYDQSDKSESESEEKQEFEQKVTEELKKADSLEFLMKELDSEIQGENEENNKTDKNNLEQNVEVPKSDSDNQKITKIDNSVSTTINENIRKTDASSSKFRKRPKSRSPLRGMYYHKKHNRQNYPTIMHHQFPPFIPINQFETHLIPFMNNPQHNPVMLHSTFGAPPAFAPYFDRPISPLTINTESLTTAARAPLSPRSAAFVLQNKAIIEKRKRSPRRSYSRSPTRSLSRSPRRSLTPIRRSLTPVRRSLTPIRRFRRSASPRRHSRSPRKRSLSPKRRSPSPKRRSLSPKRKSLSPKRKATAGNTVKGRPVHDRLGLKSEENKNKQKTKEVSNEELTDPILVARKKKFESNELKKKEGIIRLKPKDEKLEVKSDEVLNDDISQTPKVDEEMSVVSKNADESVPLQKIETSTKETDKIEKKDSPKKNKPTPESSTDKKEDYDRSKDPEEFKELERLLNDDAILDELLDHKVADIFSDEESASDNEGRFKAKTKHGEKKVPVLSFNKLVNGTKPEIKTETLSQPSKSNRSRQNEEKSNKPLSSKSKATIEKQSSTKSSNTQSGRQKITLKTEKTVPAPTIDKIHDRKIEIKIKHPSKYQKSNKSKLHKIESVETTIPTQSDTPETRIDDDIIIEDKSDSGDEENAVLTQGDLRTQLSRKRAEKLYKLPSDQESVSSRILQYALQGALFKKSKKSKRKVLSAEGVSGIQGGRLPIHLRLGMSNTEDVVEEVKIKKKKKRKVHEILEQV